MAVVSLVVMESGSEWPGRFGASADVVALRPEGERLLRRTCEKLDELRRTDQDVRTAVLACNRETDDKTDACRAQVARALMAAVRGKALGRLVLCASGSASCRLRQELFSLTGALTEELAGTTATVSLRFMETTAATSR